MSLYTVIGGHGFIGNEIVNKLLQLGHEVFVPKRDDPKLHNEPLGTVIYCAGHGDCQGNPIKVFNSNTKLVADLIQHASFTRFVYISSTRLYMGQETADEQQNLSIITTDNRRLFNLTKLVSEELCLLSNDDVIIVRPSNVYGVAINSPLFLPAITRNAINNGVVDMYVTPQYNKDYVAVSDVANAVCLLAEKSKLKNKIFNIASGINTSASEIANVLAQETGCDINWHKGTTDEVFPITSITAIKEEINFTPLNVLDDLKKMVADFKQTIAAR
jgi:nucleoside-diphosphate-sugar epimerase